MRNECLMAIKQTRLLNFTHKKTAMLSGADFRFVLRLRALVITVYL
nr:MAG TPA: hypothetical protein [Bacteriophage sp.]DAW74729.1 MAG TPA: hypothetical protein [Caudoviricetes sp.]